VLVRKSLLDMAAVLGCKAGGILVNLLFLPIYQRLMTPEDFGFVALAISIQTLFNIMDLGTATLIARDISAARALGDIRQGWQTWRNSEGLFLMMFLAAFGAYSAAALSAAISGQGWGFHQYLRISLAMGLLLAVALNNMVFTALNALQVYRGASLIQVVGVLGRAILTVACLLTVNSGILSFLLVQALAALVHLLVSRAVLERVGTRMGLVDSPRLFGRGILALLFRAKHLILLGISGAFATQLDKSIISMNMSLRDVGPYFLAYTYALTPASVFSGPVSQFFLPKVVGHLALTDGDPRAFHVLGRNFALALSLTAIVPCALLFFYCPEWIALWLHGSAKAVGTAVLAKVFLFAGLACALSYIPSILLNAAQDYRFLSLTSAVMTPPLLAAVWVCTRQKSLIGVVWTYVAYHLLTLVLLMVRGLEIKSLRRVVLLSCNVMIIVFFSVNLFIGLVQWVVRYSGVPFHLHLWIGLIATMAASFALLAIRPFRKLITQGIEI